MRVRGILYEMGMLLLVPQKQQRFPSYCCGVGIGIATFAFHFTDPFIDKSLHFGDMLRLQMVKAALVFSCIR